MKPVSLKIFWALMIVLASLAALNLFLPQGEFQPLLSEQELPASKKIMALVNAGVVLVLYGGLGWLGAQWPRQFAVCVFSGRLID